MKNCAFLTMDNMHGFVSDDELAVKPLAELGWRVHFLPWKQTSVSWADFDAVIMRTTWDYHNDPQGFLSVLEQITRQTRLENNIRLVRWNMHKGYLADLQHRGIPTVPTVWGGSLTLEMIQHLLAQLNSQEIVLKPVIGANAQDAVRIALGSSRADWLQAAETYACQPFMAQPFMPAIVNEGEYSLFYFAGVYSHAILKQPGAGDFRVQEEHGGLIQATTPEAALLKRAAAAVAAVTPAPLYARVDLVRTASGDFAVMELELIEPSLYLRMNVDAPRRFAAALNSWMKKRV